MNLQIKIAFILELSMEQRVWNGILLLWDEDDKMPHALTTSVLTEEERRIAYVGITRPKTNLFLTWVEKRWAKNFLLHF